MYFPHLGDRHTAHASLWLQEQPQTGTVTCDSGPQAGRKVTVKHSRRAVPGIAFLSHGLEHPAAAKGGGSTLLQTILHQGGAGHVSKIVSQVSRRSSFPRALKRSPDCRDPLIFSSLCQAHHQRCKTLVFQHALASQT